MSFDSEERNERLRELFVEAIVLAHRQSEGKPEIPKRHRALALEVIAAVTSDRTRLHEHIRQLESLACDTSHMTEISAAEVARYLTEGFDVLDNFQLPKLLLNSWALNELVETKLAKEAK